MRAIPIILRSRRGRVLIRFSIFTFCLVLNQHCVNDVFLLSFFISSWSIVFFLLLFCPREDGIHRRLRKDYQC